MDERGVVLMRELHESGVDLGALTAAFSAIARDRRPRDAFDIYVNALYAHRDDEPHTPEKGTHGN